MYKIKTWIIIFILGISVAFAQVMVIKNCNPHTIQKYVATVIQINSTDVIAINGKVRNNNLIINKLEDNFDTTRFYFILYPTGFYTIEALKKYGEVLFATDTYIIFKSLIEVLNDYKEFSSCKIVSFNSLPTSWSQEEKRDDYNRLFLQDTTIYKILNSLSVDSIWKHIEKLQTLERYTTNSKVTQSVTYLANYFNKLGFDTVYQHTWQSGSSPNIIGIKYGKTTPNEIYIMDAHYDAAGAGLPAADDNGSGTAGVMEAARVLSKYSFKKTIRFILFSGEEIGLKGSAAYARDAKNKNDNIKGVINMDMIAWNNSEKIEVFIAFQELKPAFYNTFRANATAYIPGILCVDGSSSSWVSQSDHASFWNNGYDNAIYLGDDLIGKNHPYYHQSTDLLGTAANSKNTAQMFLKAATVNIAALAEVWHSVKSVDKNKRQIKPQVMIYVNRTSRKVTLSMPFGLQDIIVDIFNIKGQSVVKKRFTFAGENSNLTIDCSDVTEGTYYLKFTSKTVSMWKKIVLTALR